MFSQRIPNYYALPAIILSTLLAVIVIFAWQEPSQAPPGGNVPAPINVGDAAQIKTGPLQVSGFKNIGSTVFSPLSSAPSSPVPGQLYFDDNLKIFKWYDGTGWQQFGPGLTPSEKSLLCDKDTDTYLDNRCSGGTDCNDNDAKINPKATEICDNIDNDCDGKVDGITRSCTDVCGTGSQTCTAGSWGGCGGAGCDYSPGCSPAYESQSCGTCGSQYRTRNTLCCGGCSDWSSWSSCSDPGYTTYYRDADGDGYGNPAVTTQACSQPSGYVTNNTDCDDNCSSCYPGGKAIAIKDGKDQNCNGTVDEMEGWTNLTSDLNAATNKSCNTFCAEKNKLCKTIGHNCLVIWDSYPAESGLYWHWFDWGLGTSAGDCNTVMQDQGISCWDRGNCEQTCCRCGDATGYY